jgi:hypothetical protein
VVADVLELAAYVVLAILRRTHISRNQAAKFLDWFTDQALSF